MHMGGHMQTIRTLMMIQCASFAIINEFEIEGRMTEKKRKSMRVVQRTQASLKKTVATA